MEIHQILKILLGKDGPYEEDQTALGEELGIEQSLVSKLQRRTLPTWEDHWKVSLKLFPLCNKLGIDPARELKTDEASQLEKGLHHVTQFLKKQRAGYIPKDSDPRGDNKTSQPGKKHLPPSGDDSNQRRKP